MSSGLNSMSRGRLARFTGDVAALRGARILLTGVTGEALEGPVGTLVETLATITPGLLLHTTPEHADGVVAFVSGLTGCEHKVAVLCHDAGSSDDGIRLAQIASALSGSLDLAVVLLDGAVDASRVFDLDDLEDVLVERLDAGIAQTEVLANRMGLTWSDGAIVSVLLTDPETDAILTSLLKSALAGVTRWQAEAWAVEGVRFNAVALAGVGAQVLPGVGAPCADLTTVVVDIAVGRSAPLTGLVFEAA
ncbi:MAG: hypothetical protein ACFCUN_02160 [Hyphomicrobiaceae bacterium]